MTKEKVKPYPQELRRKLFALAEKHAGTGMREVLNRFFNDYPEFKNFESRLTVERARAMVGMLRRQKARAAAKTETPRGNGMVLTSLHPNQTLLSRIRGTAAAMKRDGKRPRVILKALQEKYPNVTFPPASLTLRFLFHNEKPKRTPTKKYAVEGEGFRMEITSHNPKMKAKIAQMISLLLEE